MGLVIFPLGKVKANLLREKSCKKESCKPRDPPGSDCGCQDLEEGQGDLLVEALTASVVLGLAGTVQASCSLSPG